MVRDILIKGDPLLLKKSHDVTVFDDRLHAIIDDMIETMDAADGVGLAAPQIGILRKIVVIRTPEDGLFELINPTIIEESGEVEDYEGCLSVPDLWGIVKRPQHVVVQAQDRNGQSIEITGENLLARAICHEVDHLKGVLFTDKASSFIDPAELKQEE